MGLTAGLISFALMLAGMALLLWRWPFDRRLGHPAALSAEARALIARDPEAWLAAAEARFDDLTIGAHKRILWHGARGQKTALSLLYLHGFTATSEETRPLSDQVAAAFGANLVLTRFTGHARPGRALAEARAEDWIADLAEALAVAGATGEQILVLATSQGASILTAALGDPAQRAALPELERLFGVVMIAPNFRLASPLRALLSDLPAADRLLQLFVGPQVEVPVRSPAHGRFWTTRYPVAAVLPMAKILRAARAADLSELTLPLLLLRSPDDRVVSPRAADRALRGWRGPVEKIDYPKAPGMDEGAHVIAGDIRSPGMTAQIAADITDWVRRRQSQP